MSFFQKMSLRMQLLSLLICIVLAGFTITLSFMAHRASNIQEATAGLYVERLALYEGGQAVVPLEQAVEAVRTAAATLTALKKSGQANRDVANAILREILEKNPFYAATWTVWEPNAFDGRDTEYANTPGHDSSGRYIPNWSREENGRFIVDPLNGYEDPQQDFYIPLRNTNTPHKTILLEPDTWNIGGKTIWITTLVTPIHIDGRFMGVVGIDIALTSLQKAIENIKIYTSGYGSLLSHHSIFIGDKNATNIGKPLDTTEGLTNEIVNSIRQATQAGSTYHGIFSHPHFNNKKVNIIQVPIEINHIDTPWSFFAIVPTNEILADVYTLQWLATVLGNLCISRQRMCLHMRAGCGSIPAYAAI